MPPSQDPPDDGDLDVTRRRFMRSIGRDAFHAAGAVFGAADALRRVGPVAATRLLGIESDNPVVVPAEESFAVTRARSPYRVDGDTIWLVDQNDLPESLREIACDTAGAVAREMRMRTVSGAPVLGQVAAHAVAISMSRARTWSAQNRELVLSATIDVLKEARPSIGDVQWTLRRMLEVAKSDPGASGDELAEALRREAGAIADQASTSHIRLAHTGIETLGFASDRPLQAATFGSTGRMATGTTGTALGVLIAAHHSGRPIHVWVGESRPGLDGSRLSAPELAAAGVPHTVVSDATLGALLTVGRIDVMLFGANRVAINGDVCGVAGTCGLAIVAARHGVAVVFAVPASSIDKDCRDHLELSMEWQPIEHPPTVPDSLDGRGGWIRERYPVVDATPCDVISAFVTDEGVVHSPFGPGLADVVERARSRRALASAPDRGRPDKFGPDKVPGESTTSIGGPPPDASSATERPRVSGP